MSRVAVLPHINPERDRVVEQFGICSAKEGGGLLLRGVRDRDALERRILSIPEPSTSQTKLKARRHNLEKYSYIRSDTCMKVFAGRNMGLLVDPHLAWEHVRIVGEKLAIHFEDAQSGRDSSPKTAKDLGLAHQDITTALDNLVIEQNKNKKRGWRISNWNEVELLTASCEAYVGLFYAWPTAQTYEEVFPTEEKARLAMLWHERTTQQSLKVYLYKHRGNPHGEEALRASQCMGLLGASELILLETIPCLGLP